MTSTLGAIPFGALIALSRSSEASDVVGDDWIVFGDADTGVIVAIQSGEIFMNVGDDY